MVLRRVLDRLRVLPALALVALAGLLALGVYWPSVAVGRAARGLLLDGLVELARVFPELPSGYVMLRGLEDQGDALAVALLGLLGGVWWLLPARNQLAEDPDEKESGSVERRRSRKVRARAASLARGGDAREAGEFCRSRGLLDEAVEHFLAAEELACAAEVRHEQERFVDAAELYAQAGCWDSAAVLFEHERIYVRAAEMYSQSGNPSQAACMYEQAEMLGLAAEHYEKAEFYREAARAFARSEEWERAAVNLEHVVLEEARAGQRDEAAKGEYQKLVESCGQLFLRAGLEERAESVLVGGGCFAAAARVAAERGDSERAAELYVRARDPERAAGMLESLGRKRDAMRLRAERLRDHGDSGAAALHFERAGEWLDAAELFRVAGEDERAAACYERSSAWGQAAEIYESLGEARRAALNFARAERFEEAAACFAGLGDSEAEVEMLERGGAFLRAARMHRNAGRASEAVAALQRVSPDHPDFVAAAACLGEIFCTRGEAPLAIAKLSEVLSEREIDALNVRAFCSLAAAHEANGEFRRAGILYEKILAYDYQLAEASQGLERCRHVAAAADDEQAPEEGRPASPRYVVEATLGRGGMGIVYRARDTRLDRQVALKVLPESLGENPRALQSLLREARSAAQLNHPHIVTVYDAGEEQGRAYIAMEYVDGSTLRDIVRRRGPIAPRGIVEVLAHIASGLAYAHARNLVHLDVKSANIMWASDRNAKLMDFGLAKWMEEARKRSTVVSGTPYYMSPEQTRGESVDHRSDLYSLGVAAFEMATGSPPFTKGDVAFHHAHTPPPDPAQLRSDLPGELCEVIARCLRKDPAERFQSAGELEDALRALR